jgi:ADP-L-glycero-D-manno-heptose 6-epimerase
VAATYLVTGAAGFIGARFVESCAARGISVVSVDRESHFRTRPEHADVRFGVILDRDRLGHAPLPELSAIVHLGACTDTTQTDAEYLERQNVASSKLVWGIARERGIPFVYASSAATYGAGEHGFDDDEAKIARLRPLNPYGDSKQRFDLWALGEDSRGAAPPAWCGFKLFNVYGFGERHKRAMASVMLQAYDQIGRHGGVSLFRSHREGIADGEQRRDFVYVEDAVEALHFAAARPIPRGIFNLGSGRARSFLDLARAVFRAIGREPRIRFVDTPAHIREHYQYFTEARLERLRAQGFTRPFTPLEEGVARSIDRLDRAAGAPLVREHLLGQT